MTSKRQATAIVVALVLALGAGIALVEYVQRSKEPAVHWEEVLYWDGVKLIREDVPSCPAGWDLVASEQEAAAGKPAAHCVRGAGR